MSNNKCANHPPVYFACREAAEIKLEGAGFRIRTIYEDEDTYRLLAAAKEVLGKRQHPCTNVTSHVRQP